MNKIGLLHFVSIATTTGKDATNDFEDVGHSVDAHNLMKDFEIGEVDITSKLEEITYKQQHHSNTTMTKAQPSSSKSCNFWGLLLF
jgi:cytochrome b involved in lipid metabolism